MERGRAGADQTLGEGPGPIASPAPIPTAQVKGLLVDLSKRYGGASTRAITIAKGLQPWGATIAVLEGSPASEAAGREGIPVVAVGKSRFDPGIPFRIATIVRERGFELIDTQNIQSKIWGSIAARLIGTVLISTLNSSYTNEQGGSLKGHVYSLLDRLTNAKVARYIAVSENIRKSLREAGIADDKIELIHSGVRSVPAPSQIDARRLRDRLALPPDAIICTAVGRMVWAKGYADLVDAFALVAGQLPNAYCVVVGDGKLRPVLQEKIVGVGLSKRFLLLGYREHEEALEILKGSDVFVMPSRSEGIPYALLEAGALGLPILATRCGGIPEVVRDGIEAVLVEPADPGGIGAGLLKLCGDLPRARRLGAQAKLRIQKDFSMEAQIEATKQAWLRAVGRDKEVDK